MLAVRDGLELDKKEEAI